jgi:hypothetical protein
MKILFIVIVQGKHLRSHAILPSSIDPSLLNTWDDRLLQPHHSPKGWMTKDLFFEIVQKEILPAACESRKLLHLHPTTPALLFMDGASSHANIPLASLCHDNNLDVVILPAHTSHLIQPLDSSVNSIFKTDLGKQQISFPKRSELETKLKPFLQQIEDSAEKALLRPNIIESFKAAEMVLVPCTDRISTLEEAPPRCKPRTLRGFPLSGSLITSDEFLMKWKKYQEKKGIQGETLREIVLSDPHEEESSSSKEDARPKSPARSPKKKKERNKKRRRKPLSTSSSTGSSPSDLSPCVFDADSDVGFLLPKEIERVQSAMMTNLKKEVRRTDIIDVDSFEVPRLRKRSMLE